MKIRNDIGSPEEIGERISRLLKDKDLKPADIAREMGVNQSSLSNILEGNLTIGIKNIYVFSELLDTNIPFILTGEESKKSEKPDFTKRLESVERDLKILKNNCPAAKGPEAMKRYILGIKEESPGNSRPKPQKGK